jgi:hypothetical protein
MHRRHPDPLGFPAAGGPDQTVGRPGQHPLQGQNRQRLRGRFGPGLYRPAGLDACAGVGGLDRTGKAIQKAANAIEIPGEELVVPWAGVKFETTGNEMGQNVLGSGLIGQYQRGGKLTLEIVYPFELATSNMIFPHKGW